MALRFGLELSTADLAGHNLELTPRPGAIFLVAGPSGAGKTLLLEALARGRPRARLVQACPFPTDVSVIDAVAPTRGLDQAMELLTCCGLGEPRLWLRRFEQLSRGEQFRARLARAISLPVRDAETSPLLLLCDDFGESLHVRLAHAIACNLRKLVTRRRLALMVATCREELAADLQPDALVRFKGSGGAVTVEYSRDEGDIAGRTPPGPSFAADLRVERGSLRDYAQLAPMHYRKRDCVGFVDKVFALRSSRGETLGVVVYGHAAMELRPRNLATGRRFVRNPELLNRELRVLKRLILHPDIRGCGMGHRLVRESLPRAGVRFVECLAAIGVVNPIFEKAGMERIGVCELPREHERTLKELARLGVDPLSPEFEFVLGERGAAFELVYRSVLDWYESITPHARERVQHQSPEVLSRTFRQIAASRPVYYLWAADEEGQRLIERSMAGPETVLPAATLER